MLIRNLLITIAAIAMTASAANAATVNYTATYDPANATTNFRGLPSDPTQQILQGGFALDAAKSATVGDTISLTYSFGGAGITGTFLQASIQALSTSGIQDLWISGTVSFLDALGNAFSPVAVGYNLADPWTSIGSSGIGSNLIPSSNAATFGGLATTIYGIVFNGTIDSSLGAAGPRSYSFGNIQFTGYDLSVVAAVPVPAALPLLAAGVGALGFMGWRKKRSGAAQAA